MLLCVLLAALASRSAVPAQVAARARDREAGHPPLPPGDGPTVYDAEAAARAAGGTLVAIGSRAEETFLLENFGASEMYWIGLEFPRERWASDEPVAFTH